MPPPVTPLSIIVCTFGIHVYIGAYINQYSTVCNDELQSNMKYLLIVLAMQLPEAETCINRLIKNEFFVLFMIVWKVLYVLVSQHFSSFDRIISEK